MMTLWSYGTTRKVASIQYPCTVLKSSIVRFNRQRSGWDYIKWRLAKTHHECRDIKTIRRPGPYCFLTLQCHCWCLKSCGPTRRPRRAPFPRRSHQQPRCHWWWSPTQSSPCVCNGRSCRLWCPDRLSRRWFPKSSQSAGCPSQEWKASALERRKGRRDSLINCDLNNRETWNVLQNQSKKTVCTKSYGERKLMFMVVE